MSLIIAPIAALVAAVAFLVASSPAGGGVHVGQPSAAAAASADAMLVREYEAPGTPELTYRLALIEYDSAASGAAMPRSEAKALRDDRAIRQYQDAFVEASDGRIGVSVDVYSAPLWAGSHSAAANLPGSYDVVSHAYPKWAAEQLPAKIDVKYAGLAWYDAGYGVYMHEFPISVDTPRIYLSPELLLHETLHTLTGWARRSATIAAEELPPGDVHGRPASYPSEAAYFRDYIRGDVKYGNAAGLGLGVGNLIQAGSPSKMSR